MTSKATRMKSKMNMGRALLEAGLAGNAVLTLIEHVIDEGPRDLTRAEAAQLREQAGALLCAVLECERIALGIPAPRATRG